MTEWQPIETAPKGGMQILAVRFDQSSVWPIVGAVVHWSDLNKGWFSPAVGCYLYPSHWMRLSPPPAQHSNPKGE